VALTQINNEQISSASAGNASAGIDAGTKIQANTITGVQLANNISVATTGNIAAGNILTNNYFYANGAPFSGGGGGNTNYTDANVSAYLSSGSANANIITTANVSGAFVLGNGSALTSITGTNVVGNVPNATFATSATTAVSAGTVTTNAQPNITSVGTLSALSVTGNISGNYILGNGSQLTGIAASYDNANVKTYLSAFDGDIIPSSNNTFTLGNLTNQWSSVYVGANTIYFNGVPLSANVTTLFYDSKPLVTENVDGNINTPGAITAGTFVGNGAALTSITGANVVGNVTSAITAGTVTTNAQPNITEVGTLSTLSVTGNISANYFIGNGAHLTNIVAANIVGTVANATYAVNANLAAFANTAFSVAGANVTGEVAVANTVSNPSQPNITALGTITSLTANGATINGLFTANSNAQFNGDVYFAGNVTIPGNINQISGNSGQFFGNVVTGFGALYAGLPAGYTLLDQEVMQYATNFDGYTQVSLRNINGGADATADYVITADNGTDSTNYADFGMAGSGYDGATAVNSLGTSVLPNDAYLYAKGNVTGGNLVLGSNQAGGVVRIIANGASNLADVVATFAASGLNVNGSITGNANLTVTGNIASGNLIVSGGITGSGASPAPYLSNFSSISTTGATGNITASGYFLGNGSQLTDVVQSLVQPNNLLYVAKNGSDSAGTGSINAPFLTIQAAINTANALPSAATIILAPGSYVQDLTIANVPNGLNITGSGLTESAINGNITISGTSNNIEFDNFRISTGRVTHSASGYWSVVNLRFSANTGITKTSSATIKIFNTDLGAAGTGSVLLQAGKTNIYNSQVFNPQVSGATTEVNFLQCDTVILPTVTAGNVNFINSIMVSSGTGNSLNAVGGNITMASSLSITPTRALAPINFGASSRYQYGDSAFDSANTTFAGTAVVQDAQFQAINVRNGNVVTTGNISGSYLLGNGAFITGLPASYGNANVSDYLSSGTDTANIITTGNISGDYILSNGIVTTGTSGNITGAFAVVADYFLGDGSNITNLTAGNSIVNGNSSVRVPVANGDIALATNGANVLIIGALGLVEAKNNFQALGNITGGNVVTTGNVSGGNLVTGGRVVATGNISGANIVATYLYGDGSNITNLTPGNIIVNGNSSVSIPTAASTIIFTVNGVNAGSLSLEKVAIGYLAGNTTQGNAAVAIGIEAGAINQGVDSIAVGSNAGNDNQGVFSIAVGALAGQTTQGAFSVAVGTNAGFSTQGNAAVAIGNDAGSETQGESAVAIGQGAGFDSQGSSAVSIGGFAGATAQGANSIAVGSGAGNDNQGTAAIAVGLNSGVTLQGAAAIAIGGGAGFNTQGSSAVAIGADSANDTQGENAIAIGSYAGFTTQGAQAIAIGLNTGGTGQGVGAVAIGQNAGQQNQGGNAIAIGASAGETDQPTNSIIINASGATLDGTESGLYIDPVRNDTGNVINAVYYNTTTKEVTYGPGATSPAEAAFTVESANFAAVSGSRYGVDASGGNVTATLPATPDTGAAIFFADAGGYSASNLLNINSGLNPIMGGGNVLTVSTPNQSVGLFWNGTTWRTY
jgi:hypothetical protein